MIFFSVRNNQHWADYIEKLKAEPGIVVIDTEKRQGKYFILGLRDPLAADPLKVIEKTKVDPKRVISRWEPYFSLYPEFILARAKELLQPPESVSLRVENGILYATGSASHQWIDEARKMARAIPGINQFRETNLVDTDLKELESHKEQIEKYVPRFVQRSTNLLQGQDYIIKSLIAEIRKLYDSALVVGRGVRIEIIGHASSEGSEEFNMILSQARADEISSILSAKGFKTTDFSAVGVGTRKPLRKELTEQDKAFNRSVSFRVNLSDTDNKKVLGP